MRQVEIRGCDHYTILQKPAFTRAFVRAVGEAMPDEAPSADVDGSASGRLSQSVSERGEASVR